MAGAGGLNRADAAPDFDALEQSMLGQGMFDTASGDGKDGMAPNSWWLGLDSLTF